jgi:hypothetical protein
MVCVLLGVWHSLLGLCTMMAGLSRSPGCVLECMVLVGKCNFSLSANSVGFIDQAIVFWSLSSVQP